MIQHHLSAHLLSYELYEQNTFYLNLVSICVKGDHIQQLLLSVASLVTDILCDSLGQGCIISYHFIFVVLTVKYEV